MTRSISLYKVFASCLLVMSLAACATITKATAPVVTPVTTAKVIATQQVTVLPTQPSAQTLAPTLTFTPTVTNIPKSAQTKIPTAQPSSTSSPNPILPTAVATETPVQLSTPTQVASTLTTVPTSATSTAGSYAVILIAKAATLPVHQSAGNNTLVVDKLASDDTGISLTGKQTTLANQVWVEIQRSNGGTGWVNRANLTESVDAGQFCDDSAKDDLLTNLATALADKDGAKLAELVSPIHGLNLQYIRGGTVANYNAAKASWLFNSTYVMPWGLNPGSGLPVTGTFSTTVLPNLIKVFGDSNTQTCNEITLGGATYTYTWPDTYSHVNYLSLYQAGAEGKEQDWRTWVVGIEYVTGKPYLFSLNYLNWEP